MPVQEETNSDDMSHNDSKKYVTRRQVLTHSSVIGSTILAGCGGQGVQPTETLGEESTSNNQNDSVQTTVPSDQKGNIIERFSNAFLNSKYERSASFLSKRAERLLQNKILGFRQIRLSDGKDVLHRLHRSILSQHGRIDSINISSAKSGENTVVLQQQDGSTQLKIVVNEEEIETIYIESSYTQPAYTKPDEFDEQTVKFVRDSVTHDGTLTTPRTDGPTPLVILAQGTGNYDQDSRIGPNRIFADLARGLASNGIAVYRFDRTTPQQISPFTPSEAYTPDITNALDSVLSEPGIRNDAVYLVGHSMGGRWAPHVASVEDRISGIGILDSTAFDFLTGLKFALNSIKKQQFRTKREKQLAKRRIKKVKKISSSGSISDKNIGYPKKWLKENIEYDHTKVAARLGKPVFVLSGGRGPIGASKEESNMGLWNTYLSVWYRGRENHAVIYDKDLNHYLQSGSGPSTWPSMSLLHDNISKNVVESLTQWILDVTNN